MTTPSVTLTSPTGASAELAANRILHSRDSTGGSSSSVATGSRTAPLMTSDNKRAGHRKRSSSLVTVEKIEQSHEELLDQSAGFNANADWVNYKGGWGRTAREDAEEERRKADLAFPSGAWVIHVVLILLGKILVDVIPGMEQDTSWTIVNLGYMAVRLVVRHLLFTTDCLTLPQISFLMFHYVTGTPFESNAGVYDELTLWEQIDEGAQYTPAKKWLTSVPIGL